MAKSLIIPIELDAADAIKKLKVLEEEGKKAGDTGEEAGKKTSKSFEQAGSHADGLSTAILKANLQMKAMELGKEMISMVGQAAVDAAADVKKMADQFINLRDRARELAGVMGRAANIPFTQEQYAFAKGAGFADASQAVEFRTEFLGEAQQYADRFTSPEEFAKFESEAARLGNRYNIPPEVIAKVAGVAVRTGPKEGQTAESTMQTLGGVLSTQMAGAGRIKELATQIGRMSGLIGPGRAFRDMGEAATSTRMSAETDLALAYERANVMREAVVDLTTDEKKEDLATDLGVTVETTNFEAIKKLSEAQSKSGENMDAFLKKYFPLRQAKEGFRDAIEAYRGGVMIKGLNDARAVIKGQVEAENRRYYADITQPGALDVAKAETAEVEAKLGTDRATIEPYMQRAKTQLAEFEHSQGGKFMDWGFRHFIQPARGIMGHPDVYRQGYGQFEQTETAAAMGMIRREAESVGIDTKNAPSVLNAPQVEVTRYLAELVRHTKEMKEHQQQALPKAPPITPVGNQVNQAARP